MFRTAIRNGVSKGWGVNHFDEPQVKLDGPQAYPYPRGNEHEGPNFAGHYFVITWGCGTGCLGIVVVDAITGRIFPPPLSIDKRNPLAIPQFGMYSALFDYRVDSRLFAMSTCTETTKPSKLACRISYFIMEDNGFKLIKNVDLPDMSLTVEP
ncbi:MAG: hypothetical protein HY651_07040 [Acidobacteria bacterium]|nr:hypothetical protein [Acidobacteriota bacterium]